MGADNNQKESTIIKDAFILFFITLIAGILLSMVNEITKGPIAEAEVAAKQKGYKQVFAVANIVAKLGKYIVPRNVAGRNIVLKFPACAFVMGCGNKYAL